MTNARMTVSPERWKGMDENERTWLIYDSLIVFDKRIIQLEHGKWFYKTLAFFGGVIGGIISFLSIKFGGLG